MCCCVAAKGTNVESVSIASGHLQPGVETGGIGVSVMAMLRPQNKLRMSEAHAGSGRWQLLHAAEVI